MLFYKYIPPSVIEREGALSKEIIVMSNTCRTLADEYIFHKKNLTLSAETLIF